MSQVASAYIVPPAALSEVERHMIAGNWTGFWERLRPFEAGIAFPHSGYVLAVLAQYLKENGVELPVSHDPSVKQLVDRCEPLACTNQPGATAAAESLAGVNVSDVELGAYWHEFTGEEDVEAGVAMKATLDWLRQVFSATQATDWCLILVG
jgi:hypothetical protein